MPAPLITSRANPRVKQLRAAFAGFAEGLVAIEGENLLREAMRSGIALRAIFLSQRVAPPAWLPPGVEILHLADALFAAAVDTQSPQGIAALMEPPRWALGVVLAAWPEVRKRNTARETGALSKDAAAHSAPLLLIAAGLQDPGNLGTLIRSAEAFAATAVLTTPGTVSLWNQKALRASAGSVFRVPVVAVTADDLAGLKSRGIPLLAAVAPESPFIHGAHAQPNATMRALAAATPASAIDLVEACAILIGNEGAGIAPDLLALADVRIAIPTPGPVESLNAAVAGSLLLYEAARQREAARLRPTRSGPKSISLSLNLEP